MTHYLPQDLTRYVLAECEAHSLEGYISPEADLDGLVRFFDVDEGQEITLNGWLWTFEDAAP